VICGIDVGLGGAVAFIEPRGPAVREILDMPVHLLKRGGKAKREVDVAGLVGLFALRHVEHAFVELAGAMPRQGVASAFAFGKGFGIVLGVLAARGVPLTLVSAAKWKRTLQLPKGKAAARARASQLLPQAAHYWPLAKHDGRAEAALLALFGARLLGGAAAVPADIFVPANIDTPKRRRPVGVPRDHNASGDLFAAGEK
jgi:crossover junction endodeoxyribonuclease RuvC